MEFALCPVDATSDEEPPLPSCLIDIDSQLCKYGMGTWAQVSFVTLSLAKDDRAGSDQSFVDRYTETSREVVVARASRYKPGRRAHVFGMRPGDDAQRLDQLCDRCAGDGVNPLPAQVSDCHELLLAQDEQMVRCARLADTYRGRQLGCSRRPTHQVLEYGQAAAVRKRLGDRRQTVACECQRIPCRCDSSIIYSLPHAVYTSALHELYHARQ